MKTLYGIFSAAALLAALFTLAACAASAPESHGAPSPSPTEVSSGGAETESTIEEEAAKIVEGLSPDMTGERITVEQPDTAFTYTTPTKLARWECFFEDNVCTRVVATTEFAFKDDAKDIYSQLTVNPDYADVSLNESTITSTWLAAPFLGFSYYETAVNLRVMGYEPVLS